MSFNSRLFAIFLACSFVFTSADALRDASRGAQLAFAAAFIVVNGVLVALLRRSPRGIDA